MRLSRSVKSSLSILSKAKNLVFEFERRESSSENHRIHPGGNAIEVQGDACLELVGGDEENRTGKPSIGGQKIEIDKMPTEQKRQRRRQRRRQRKREQRPRRWCQASQERLEGQRSDLDG